MIKRITSSKGIVTAVWVLGLVVIWEICAFIVGATQRTPVNVLPHLYQIIGSFFDTKSITGSGDTIATLVFSSAAETLSRALIGFIIGMVLGYILALLMHLSHIVEKIAFPYLMIIQMIPILGMAPIVLSITGDISSARIIIAAILTFYPVSTNTLAGFKSVGRERHELMRSYGANKFQLYTKMLIPSAMSYFFTGLKISAPMAITASILVDTLQGGNGLGCQDDLAYTLTATDRHAVYSRQRVDDFRHNDVASTQSARQYKDATDLICQQAEACAHLIRRLTPLECERLQGFPDGWTDIPGASDSARYKALGNSVAIPCVEFIMSRIAAALL